VLYEGIHSTRLTQPAEIRRKAAPKDFLRVIMADLGMLGPARQPMELITPSVSAKTVPNLASPVDVAA